MFQDVSRCLRAFKLVLNELKGVLGGFICIHVSPKNDIRTFRGISKRFKAFHGGSEFL